MGRQKQSLRKLRKMMRELFNAKYGGADSLRIVRAQGLADGYMRALSDLGVVEEEALLDLIAKERDRAAVKIDSRYASSLRTSVIVPYPV